MNLEN